MTVRIWGNPRTISNLNWLFSMHNWKWVNLSKMAGFSISLSSNVLRVRLIHLDRWLAFFTKFPRHYTCSRTKFFSLKKWKTFRKWSGIVSFVSLLIKKTVDSRRNNSGKGKTERDVSFCCAFCRSYFAFI